ncbi:DNA ligase [Nosema bombycis CQ1]|uniref:DNA ligase n=1 Tax=Nosema bombycis (strain CQ1 / CVCC 102059) TaxID=578461 RepID=R0M0C9_NOSB1|nr:DNA ligase [Nosema bombycis CQ1]|eukprot:EOB11459.1 DNA ligase [Nosema bombycis CQ1]
MADNNSFLLFSETMERINNTSSRLQIQDILSNYYLSLDGSSLIYAVYLSTSTFYPEYKNIQLNIGDKIIMDILSECTGLKKANLKKEFSKVGDYGIIGMKYRTPQLFISKKKLNVKEVVMKMREISEINGMKSKEMKSRKMLEMVAICSPLETKYIFRLFEEKLKVKISFSTVLISLSKVFGGIKKVDGCSKENGSKVDNDGNDDNTLTPINFQNEVKDAYHRKPDLELLVKFLQEEGINNLINFTMTPGIPLKPMLATPSKDVSSAYKKVENSKFTCEFKYDGERVQIHSSKNCSRTFSRNLEDNSEKYPDIKIKSKNNKDYILDGEVVAYDKENKKIMSFQELSTRKRKANKKESGSKNNELSSSSNIPLNTTATSSFKNVNICVFIFDCLYFDGLSLINKPLEFRRQILRNEFEEIENVLYFSEFKDCSNTEEIEDFFKKACDGNYEGIMIKQLNSNYIPSQRSNSWIKLKKDYIDQLGDSFDLIVIGAYYGKGKRAGVYGGFLLGSYNKEDCIYESICKIGTGFSEEDLQIISEEINNKIVNNNFNLKVKDQIKPDVWVKPELVWEIKAAGVSLSPIYSCYIKEGDKGLSLRFPRFIRSRKDKKAEEGTSSEEIYKVYKEVSE